MDSPQTNTRVAAEHGPARCYGCFRPKRDCFCALIPQIDNRTDVLILQHVRERFHPFNTARIVHRALKRSTLLVDPACRLAAAPLSIKPGAVLLYPGPDARPLSDLPADRRPEQLVIVDGTWHHAKTLVRDIPLLASMPRYRIVPASPGRYRIRREPSATSLSTVEAAVAALRHLEPETEGLDALLAAFEMMVQRQLTYPTSQPLWRRSRHRGRTIHSIPRILVEQLDNVVVAYGESSCGDRGSRSAPRLPVCWVAERLGSGERFSCTIRPDGPLTEEFLGHLELEPRAFAHALTPAEFRTAWKAFLRPSDTLAVYSQSTARLLQAAAADSARCLVLKSVPFNPDRRNGTLDEILAAEQISCPPPWHPGRAGRRLANAVALTGHLHALAAPCRSGEEQRPDTDRSP